MHDFSCINTVLLLCCILYVLLELFALQKQKRGFYSHGARGVPILLSCVQKQCVDLLLIPVRAADPGIENIYDLGVPITTRGPYPRSCTLRRPIDSPHLTVTVVDLGVPILTRGSLSYR